MAMSRQVRTVILAGGKGTRIREVENKLPKPMIDICGKPLLHRQLDWLRSQNVDEVTLITGHLGEKIRGYFSNGENFGISISYIQENEPLGTAGSLALLNKSEKPTLLINGDVLFDISLRRLIQYHVNMNADITLVTHPNDHPYDSSIIETSSDGRVKKWHNKEDSRGCLRNRVNAGIHLLNSIVIEEIVRNGANRKIDLDREILKPSISKKRIFAYDTTEYIKDIGTPDRYAEACEEFLLGIVESKNRDKTQKAFFLDRDGTINRHSGFITKQEQVELEFEAAEAIKKINKSGFLGILITNQPVIARGDCTKYQLEIVHNRLEELLGERGAYLDDIFYCPHHPHGGYEGEIAEYKVRCDCRKPKPGLIYQAAEKHNIDLSKSYMIGDSVIDVQAGSSAGCKTGYIYSNEGSDNLMKKNIVKADYLGSNLEEVVEKILYDYYKNTF